MLPAPSSRWQCRRGTHPATQQKRHPESPRLSSGDAVGEVLPSTPVPWLSPGRPAARRGACESAAELGGFRFKGCETLPGPSQNPPSCGHGGRGSQLHTCRPASLRRYRSIRWHDAELPSMMLSSSPPRPWRSSPSHYSLLRRCRDLLCAFVSQLRARLRRIMARCCVAAATHGSQSRSRVAVAMHCRVAVAIHSSADPGRRAGPGGGGPTRRASAAATLPRRSESRGHPSHAGTHPSHRARIRVTRTRI